MFNNTKNNVDINECSEDTDSCAQNCHNTIGSYTCSCTTGYRLASDGRGCNGKYSKSSVKFNAIFYVLSIGHRYR